MKVLPARARVKYIDKGGEDLTSKQAILDTLEEVEINTRICMMKLFEKNHDGTTITDDAKTTNKKKRRVKMKT